MSQPMKELVLMRKHEDGRIRIRMTPRKAWGICYGYILRDMHIRKLDNRDLGPFAPDGSAQSVSPVVDVQFDLTNGRTIHVDEAGLWIHYGNSFAETTEPACSDTLEELMALARWYGPFNQSMLDRYMEDIRPYEVPHVRMPGILEEERREFAEWGMYGSHEILVDARGKRHVITPESTLYGRVEVE